MKKLVTLFLGILLFSNTVFAGKLLVLIEPTARAYLGPTFDEWIYTIRKKETNFLDGVIVREHPRWNRTWVTNNWPALNNMSNDVAYFNPTAIMLIGNLPYLIGGSWNPDGHESRCFTSDVWLAINDFTFTDTTDWGMIGYDPVTTPMNRNIPGDGRPDQVVGTKSRWVGRIDFAGLYAQPIHGNFSGGCLNGLTRFPGINEGTALRAYFTNNLAYRTGRWTTTATGIVTGGNDAYDTYWSAITNSNRAVTWTRSVSAIPGGSARYYYDTWDEQTETENLYDGSCNPSRGLIEFSLRSYTMETYRETGVPFRRLFPGRQTQPYFLVYLWVGFNVFWRNETSNTVVGQIIDTSTTAYGGWPLGLNFMGDVTLPITPQSTPSTRAQANTLIITP